MIRLRITHVNYGGGECVFPDPKSPHEYHHVSLGTALDLAVRLVNSDHNFAPIQESDVNRIEMYGETYNAPRSGRPVLHQEGVGYWYVFEPGGDGEFELLDSVIAAFIDARKEMCSHELLQNRMSAS